ncbi:hypothetical protein VNO78_07263 [Psophocarpus tetragonolobus]|uniref:Uncharacterized protein n=1 Tax=Psophocarpus tetragonolobus TaxID=3891 RepID=A0AAN9XS93_PSOTE
MRKSSSLVVVGTLMENKNWRDYAFAFKENLKEAHPLQQTAMQKGTLNSLGSWFQIPLANNTEKVIKNNANDIWQANSCDHPILIRDHSANNAIVTLSHGDNTKQVSTKQELELILQYQKLGEKSTFWDATYSGKG